MTRPDEPRPFCEVCGMHRDDHPIPPPGPPSPPPERHDGVWRPPHDFLPSRYSLPELLDERDAQIDLWRKRYYAEQRKLDAIRKVAGDA